MAHTLYVDESGLFVAPQRGGDVGLRVVGGVLLEGRHEALDVALRDEVSAALGWWPGAWHSVDLVNPVKVAFAVRRAERERLPADLASIHPMLCDVAESALVRWIDDNGVRDALRQAGEVLRDAALSVLQARGRRVVASVEEDTRPQRDRCDPMTEALLRWVVSRTPESSQGPVDVVIASRSPQRAERDWEAWLRGAQPGWEGALRVRSALECPGLFFADLICYFLGPRGRQAQELTPMQRASETLDAWSARLLELGLRLAVDACAPSVEAAITRAVALPTEESLHLLNPRALARGDVAAPWQSARRWRVAR